MADDRMAIVCKKCNLGIAIAKRYRGFDWSNYPLNATRVAYFFVKHADCGAQGYGTHQYRLGYEDDEEDDWEYDAGVSALWIAEKAEREFRATFREDLGRETDAIMMLESTEPLEVTPRVSSPRDLPLRTVYKGQRPPEGTYAASLYDLAVEWGKLKEAFYDAFPWPERAVNFLLRMINSVQRIKERLWRR